MVRSSLCDSKFMSVGGAVEQLGHEEYSNVVVRDV